MYMDFWSRVYFFVGVRGLCVPPKIHLNKALLVFFHYGDFRFKIFTGYWVKAINIFFGFYAITPIDGAI